MGLQNVEKMAVQKNHEQTWFNRYKTKIGVATAVVASSITPVVPAGFFAAADVTTATADAGGEAVLKEVALWVLGIAVSIAVFLKIVSMVKK